jgi:hydroxyethylthiazole kinase-like uncharacterized protein yjeF
MRLPQPDVESDKEARGCVLAVGGSAEVPGAVLLAGMAALRAGAGKLQLATVASTSSALGIAVPESLIVPLPQTRTGEISGSRAHALLREHVEKADALLVGPGMSSERAAHAVVAPLVRHMRDDATLVLDAAAIFALRHDALLLQALHGRAVLTPHAGEMATLLSTDIGDIEANPADAAGEAASRFGAIVVLKGPESWIAQPKGKRYRYSGGVVGLATSGSGDVLAGVLTGLAARGASATTAALWSVYLHGAAGRMLAKRLGPIGFLARELPDEVPRLLRSSAKSSDSHRRRRAFH